MINKCDLYMFIVLQSICKGRASARHHCLLALSTLDVLVYASRVEITKFAVVSLALPQTEDFVFSLKGAVKRPFFSC